MLRYSCTLIVLFAVLVPTVGLAQDAADDAKAAEKVLADKGLRKFGNNLAAIDETKLSKQYRGVPRLRKAVLDAEKALAAVEKKAADNQKLITKYTQDRRKINAALGKGGLTITQNNQLVTLYNELGERINLLMQNGGMEKEMKAARGEHYKAREAYIDEVLSMRKLADKIKKTFADAAGDPEAQAAVAKLNQATGKKFALKESPRFTALQNSLTRLEESILSEHIDLRADGSDTYHVPVALNGKYVKELCVDSGSSLISLPFKMAREVGLTPDSGQDITVVLADGREVTAKLVTIPKVRVGKFEVEDVECAVMPADLPNAAPILGMSFLRNFRFKIDSAAKKLSMTRIETGGSRKPRR